MSTKSDVVGVNVGSSREGIKGVNAGKVEDSERKTLVQNSGYLGQVAGEVLVDGNKGLQESKVLVGGGRLVDAKSETKSGEGRRGMGFKMTDRFDETKNRVVEMMSRDDGWGSLGVMNLVGKVLGGKSCMDDDMEDVKKFGSRNDINSIVAEDVEDAKNFGSNHDGNNGVDWDAWQDVINEPVFENGKVGNETAISIDLDSEFDFSREAVGLNNVMKLGNDINSIVADEVEDVKNFGTNHHGNIDVKWNMWQNVIGEPVFEDGGVVNETVISRDLDSKLDCSLEGAGLSIEQHSVINELVPDGGLESKWLNNTNSADELLQSGCGEECVTRKEGEYNVSAIVWGKVRSHPWWPGQIMPPSAASDKAMKHFKEDTYLVAYFGDQTFAWTEASKIRPFWMHFSEMEKQSDAERFRRGVDCALDEVARRVELGLSCQCLPKEVHVKIKSQVIQNSGVKEESSIRDDGDCLSIAASFVPGDLLQFLKSFAKAPVLETDRLQFGIMKAQFLAFSRWKGCYQLWNFQGHGGLLENDAQFTVEEGERNYRDLVDGGLSNSIDSIKVPSKKRLSTAQDVSSRRCKHASNDGFSKKKEKCIPVSTVSANLSLQDDGKNVVKSGMKTVSAGKKRRVVGSISNSKRQKSTLSLRPSETSSRKALISGGGSGIQFDARESTIEEMIPGEFNPDDILLKLHSAAINPRQGYFILAPIIGLLRQIRNSTCLEKPHLQNLNSHSEKPEDKKSFSLETTDLRFEGTEDSYWTDRIIQGYSQEQVMFEPKNPAKDAPGAALEASTGMNAILDNQKQGDSVSLHYEAGNSSAQPAEGSEECFPTALLLNFTNLDSIPSVVNLNEIFRRYGPLDETQTKILPKSKRVKVVFKRRVDAEAAFSSTGKYSIFGPSLLSYRLQYAGSKLRAASRGRKETHP